jgi:hypothetical protein
VARKAVQPGIRIIIGLILALGASVPVQAWADNPSQGPYGGSSGIYCDPTTKSGMERRNTDAWLRAQDRLSRNFPRPNDYNSMMCGAQINNMFNSLAQSLASSIFSQIRGLIDGLIRQACQAAVAPLQIAANAICIPSFNFSLSYSMSSINTGICNGTPLFNVTPVIGSPSSYQSYPSPPLFP